MNVWRLVTREIAHRRLNFLLGLVSVAVASACLVGAVTLLNAYDLRTDRVLADKEQQVQDRVAQTERQVRGRVAESRAQVQKRGAELKDAMRKTTLKLGFHVVILPKDQNLTDVFSKNYASKFMPETYATKLAGANIVTINHLLPALEQRVEWPERNNRTFILIGIRGEVPLMHSDPKKPMLDPVPPGKIVLGNELARTENLKVGDPLTLMGRPFTVSQVYAARGDKRDITAWIDLNEAQEMLDKAGLINSIWAVECSCAFADLPKVRQEIEAILPDTNVVENGTIALARAEARHKADEDAKASLQQAEADAAAAIAQAKADAAQAVADEQAGRLQLRGQLESFESVLVPLVIVASAVWIGLLAMSNVRHRRMEIGILRAVGLRANQVLAVFLAKAALTGVVGAVIGYALGFGLGLGAGATWQAAAVDASATGKLFDPVLLVIVLVAAPLLAVLASWLPAMSAAQQDPAMVLREE
jgi:putative ABC transport system permease protein